MAIVCCRERAVLVAVYAERPQRRLPLPKDRQDGHGHGDHHHHYHHFHQNGSRVRGYNRRAELLDYARHLRASAKPAKLPSHGTSHDIKENSSVQIVAAERKPKRSSRPTCLGKWESLIPSFNYTDTTFVQKKGSFLSKLLVRLQKGG